MYLFRRTVLAVALLAPCASCGGGGSGASSAPSAWAWSGPTSPVMYAPPDAVAYIADDGEEHNATAIPGQVVVWFSLSTNQLSATSAIRALGGTLLDMIPSIRCCLVGVAGGEEGSFIDEIRATGLTEHAAPHLALQPLTGVVATEVCGNGHAERVAELLRGCEPSTDPESPICAPAVEMLGGFSAGQAAVNAINNYSDINVVNVSWGVPPPKGQPDGSQYGDWTPLQKLEYVWSVREWLVGFARLAEESERLGRDVVFVLSAGNEGAPLDLALLAARMTVWGDVSSLLSRRIVLVGAERHVFQQSCYTELPDPDVVMLDNADDAQHARKGTSYAAPRVSAMLRRAMRTQGIGAAEALLQIKTQAAGQTVLNDPCGPGVPELGGAPFYAVFMANEFGPSDLSGGWWSIQFFGTGQPGMYSSVWESGPPGGPATSSVTIPPSQHTLVLTDGPLTYNTAAGPQSTGTVHWGLSKAFGYDYGSTPEYALSANGRVLRAVFADGSTAVYLRD